MQKQFELKAMDGRAIQVYGMLPVEQPTKVLVISHGMAEHIERYQWFAQQLADAGIAVYGANHRGHGADCTLAGHYDDDCGWQKVTDDLHLIIEHIKQTHDVPLILFGHSMGSFVARQYAVRYGNLLSGLILSGSNHQPSFVFKAGLIASKIERTRLGSRKPSKVLDFLSFGTFNQRFKPIRTENDWLSRDDAQVDKYNADALCGFSCSTQFWCDFMQGLADISSQDAFQRIDSSLPVYVFSGDHDPVGRMSKGVVALEKALREISKCPTRIKLYAGGRHEMLNEINREQVATDTLEWLATI